MRVMILRHVLMVVVDELLDEVFVEEVLGLQKDGDSVRLVRRDLHAVSGIGPGPVMGFKLETEKDG